MTPAYEPSKQAFFHIAGHTVCRRLESCTQCKAFCRWHCKDILSDRMKKHLHLIRRVKLLPNQNQASVNNSQGFPRGSVSPWVRWERPGCGFEFFRRRRRRQRLEIWDFAPLGLRSKFANGLAYNRSKVSGRWVEIDGVHTNSPRIIFPCL